MTKFFNKNAIDDAKHDARSGLGNNNPYNVGSASWQAYESRFAEESEIQNAYNQSLQDEQTYVGGLSGKTNAQRELIALAIEGPQRNLMSKSDSLVIDGDRIEGVADELIMDDPVAVRTAFFGVGQMTVILANTDAFGRHAKDTIMYMAAAIRGAGTSTVLLSEQMRKMQQPENELRSFLIFDEVSKWTPEKTVGVLKPDPKWKPWMKFQGTQKPRRK